MVRILFFFVLCLAFPASADESTQITLNFSGETDLRTLVDYVSQRTNINIIFDEQLANKRVSIKSPSPIQPEALEGILRSALRMKGLILAEAEEPGWKRIVPQAQLTAVVAPLSNENGIAITRVFTFLATKPSRIEQVLRPYLSQPGGNMVSFDELGLLVTSDFSANIAHMEKLIERIDQFGPQPVVEVIQIKHAEASEIVSHVKSVLATQDKYRQGAISIPHETTLLHDGRTNQVTVIGFKKSVDQAIKMIEILDIPIPESQQPMRIYRLLHSTVEDVLRTLTTLEAEGDIKITGVGAVTAASSEANFSSNVSENDVQNDSATSSEMDGEESLFETGNSQVQISGDVYTNSIIVIAPPSLQRVYERLIGELDRRRPQVMLEVTFVILDTSNGFSLGVEISKAGGVDQGKYVTFSSFGLSDVDPGTGGLTLIPSLGFNGAMLQTDIADIVIKALKRNSRARVVASPRMLVHDNQEASLSSTAQEPFQSVNASDTVATTSFGGFVEAGTTVTLTPHISEGDYLQLEYEVELSSFSGERSGDLPPPKQENKLSSTVLIPDNHTIVIGGLTREDVTNTKSGIPILGDLPILGHLFSSRSEDRSQTTLFLFIRPVIMRDDQFRDIKYLSTFAMEDAELLADLPTSEPLVIQ